MKHRHLWAAALALAMATPAFANPHVDRIISQLRTEGFEIFETERTWLGRIRIEAEKGNLEREIVINRSTGEVLRDYIKVDEDWFPDDEDEDDALEEDDEDETEDDEEEAEDEEEDDDDEEDDT
ncbi:hypothetical protein [Cognatishimia maritima]|uniref:Ribonuclease E n=1 Tax=Cognatishimia maritima TaxID=870908 RepID=A0A1M5K8Z3_9RHOB|nr:hypothetical protein [Cognatishimia maritima]SHG49247.1 ribonuclease E [Cognatishimia maritima]